MPTPKLVPSEARVLLFALQSELERQTQILDSFTTDDDGEYEYLAEGRSFLVRYEHRVEMLSSLLDKLTPFLDPCVKGNRTGVLTLTQGAAPAHSAENVETRTLPPPHVFRPPSFPRS